MAIELNGTTGITTPGLTNTGTETIVNLTTTGNTILGDASTDTLNVGNGGLIKDASGNLGLGATPSAWGSNISKVVEMANGVSLAAFQTAGIASSYLTTNAYNDGTNWRYKVGFASSQYQQVGNSHIWFNAPSGTAGNAITWTQAMTLDASGNLLVGGTTLYNSAAGRGNAIIEGSSTAIFQFGLGGTLGGYIYHDGTVMDIRNAKNGPLTFATNGTNRMTLDASGNLLVGATSAILGGQLTIAQRSGSTSPITCDLYYASTKAIKFGWYGGEIGSISVNAGGTAIAYNTSSDYRLKNTIEPMVGALAKVAALKPCTYKWNADGSDGEGFIAHELAEVIPNSVAGEKDATEEQEYEISPAIPAVLDEEGNVVTEEVPAVMGTRTVPVYQGIDTSFLVATLTAAIQEQQAMIDELKAKVAALEAA
jgi:hypothetical protein